ncbi:MAG TPA: OFA family MFS transporter [Spirochaetota bacterium]|nr:OFA family MFS transporter [Spirochaetota bacterium]
MSDQKLFGMSAEKGRWIYIILCLIMYLCLGSVYSYSIFLPEIKSQFGISASMGNLPFMLFLFFFSILMFFGGKMMGKFGPRKLALIGGLIVGLGWALSYAATESKSITLLCLTYGVVAGGGVGLAYGAPIAIAGRWFPDRKGLAVGLMLAGFGGSALITGKLAGILIPSAGLSMAFLYFGIAFAIILFLLALPLRLPENNWKPAGWNPPAGSAAAVELETGQMIKSSTFWGLFLCYVIGCLSGLMAIGISKPVGNEVIKIAGEVATTLVGIFAIFNALGRPLFGALTDKITPRWAAILNLSMMLVVSLMMLAAGEGSVIIYVVAFCGFWLTLGGWLAIAPTATATFFGIKHYAQNYGVVFLAYGLGAILGGIISGQAKDVLGSYQYAFYPTAGLAIVGLAIALLFIKPVKK